MANFNLNKVMLGGRLTANPEIRTTPSGKSVVSFSIAVNRRFSSEGQTQTDFFNCTAWGSTAEFISRHFGKGASIFIVGNIQNRSWTDQNGNKRYATDIVADEACFVDSKSENEGGQMAAEVGKADPAKPTGGMSYVPDAYKTAPAFEDVQDDDKLPF